MRHREILAQVKVQGMGQRRKIGRAHQRRGKAVHFFADGVVFFAELDELAKLALQQARLVAQRHGLSLGERNRPPAIRMRDT